MIEKWIALEVVSWPAMMKMKALPRMSLSESWGVDAWSVSGAIGSGFSSVEPPPRTKAPRRSRATSC